MKSLNKKGWQFVLLTIVLSSLPNYFIYEDGIDSSWPLLLMWAPGIAGIVMRIIHKEGVFRGLNWNPLKGWKWILIASFIPLTIEIVTILLTVRLGGVEIKPEFFSFENGQVQLKGMAMLFGASAQPWFVFIPNFLLSYFVGTLFYSLLFAFGEELGWRGYLQKQWEVKGKYLPLLIVGIIWGLWHLPGILLGHNFPEYPILGGLILMPLVTVMFSFAFGHAFSKTNVIWVPVIFHGAVNISAEISNVAFLEETLNNALNDAIWIGQWIIVGGIFAYNYLLRRKC